MRKRAIILGLVLGLTVTSLAGCGSKNEDPLLKESKQSLVEMINNQNLQIDGLLAELDKKETLLKGITGEDIPPDAISVMGDGTGRLTLNSYKGTITFPELFIYPSGVSIPADGRISIVNGVAFAPSSNWTINLNGATAEIEHNNGISGMIKAVGYEDRYNLEVLKVELDKWLETLPPDDQIQYTKIFVADNFCGYDVLSANSMIDGENAVIRVGMVAFGQKAVSYAFVYRGEQDSVKDEAVRSLIRSMEINTAKFVME